MSQQDLPQRILESLHEAVFDDSRWPATSTLIDEACGTKGSFLLFGEGTSQDDGEIFMARACLHGQRHPELEQLYFEAYYPLDERVPRVTRLPDSRLVHVSSLYTEEELRTSIVYNEALPLFEARNSLIVRLDGPDASHIAWAVADPVEADGWSSSQVGTIERILPHLRQFVRVRQALVDAKALGSSLAMLLENAQSGVVQLDRRGRIVAVNDHARDLLRGGDGLADSDGFLHASSEADDADLQVLLARALPRFDGHATSGSMVVRRSLPAPRLALHVIPTNEGHTDWRPRRVAAVVLVVDPASRASIDPDVVAAALGLTPAESRVAVLLAEGNTIRGIAIATGRSQDAVRWHLKHIFRKRGISRQVELVKLVLSLADVPRPGTDILAFRLQRVTQRTPA